LKEYWPFKEILSKESNAEIAKAIDVVLMGKVFITIFAGYFTREATVHGQLLDYVLHLVTTMA
jgi:hypothetical protein